MIEQFSNPDEYKKDANLKNKNFKLTLKICNIIFAAVIVAFVLMVYFKILPPILCGFIIITLTVNVIQNIFDMKKSDRLTKEFIESLTKYSIDLH